MKEKENPNILQNEIIGTIKKINTAWTNGKIEDLRKCLNKETATFIPDTFIHLYLFKVLILLEFHFFFIQLFYKFFI